MSRHHTHLNARRWGVVRRAVFERDGYRCVMCGRASRLECDHAVPMQREPARTRTTRTAYRRFVVRATSPRRRSRIAAR